MTVLPESFDSMSNFEKRLNPEKVLLHYNVIKRIDARLLFPKMTILDLSGNQIASTGNLFNKTLESSMKKENYNIDSLETFEMKKNKLTILAEKNSIWGDLATNRLNNLTYIDLTGIVFCALEIAFL
jgi:Leucine-rich repeat (LRR) protein